ncbi:MAG: periplasmic heavy metal sensor [Bacteroidales bacterium]|nr:periplasmic heavy metal sensor [Bacteroidales bacterium]
MDIKKQKQLLTWIVILLVVLNLSVIGLLIFNKYSPDSTTSNYNQRDEYYNNKNRGHFDHTPGRMMNERFNFNEAQREKLIESAHLHHQTMTSYKDSIQYYRGRMIQEIAKETPDNNLLDHYINQIGLYHVKMNRATTKHFMEIKSIATPQQKDKVHDFLINVAQRKEFGMPHHRGNKHQHHSMRNRPNRQ